MKLPLIYYGDPILRLKAKPVEEITDEIRQLAKDMIETMHAHRGIGLAAPQVNRSLALFVTFAPKEGEGGQLLSGEERVFINPKLFDPSAATCALNEGCLCLPGIRADVVRPERIVIQYTSLDGQVHREELTGWDARVVMHENDHLHGMLFIDRVSDKDRQVLKPRLIQLKKKLATLSTQLSELPTDEGAEL